MRISRPTSRAPMGYTNTIIWRKVLLEFCRRARERTRIVGNRAADVCDENISARGVLFFYVRAVCLLINNWSFSRACTLHTHTQWMGRDTIKAFGAANKRLARTRTRERTVSKAHTHTQQ